MQIYKEYFCNSILCLLLYDWNKMIKINKIWKEQNSDYSYLKAELSFDLGDENKWLESVRSFQPILYDRRIFLNLDSQNFVMWYKVPAEYTDYLCTERSDAFIVACIYFAMVAGLDIHTEIPITSCLKYQLNEQIIPLLCNEKSGFKRIKIIGDVVGEVKKEKKCVGTGISCGVDSFSTILLGLKDTLPKDNVITHLAIFNTGSLNFYGYENIKSLGEWRKETESELEYHIITGKQVAKEMGLDFISIDTNIPDLYQGCFLLSHTYRNLSCILATQKMWGCYYYASAGEDVFNADIRVDTGSYDALILPNISLESLKFYVSGFELLRMDKIKIIASNPVVQKYLNVCSYGKENCGKCTKCKRTMLNLDLIGRLYDFRQAFPDMSYYKKYRWKLTTEIREAKKNDCFGYEMRQYAKQNNISFGWKSDLYHLTYPLRKLRVWIIKLLRK